MNIKAITLAFAIGFVGTAQSAPLYYSFNGEINGISDAAGIIADTFGSGANAIGTPIEYVFLVDTAADASHTLNDASVVTFSDFASSTLTIDRFYADFVSGSLIEEKDGGSANAPGDVAEHNFGFSRNDTGSAPAQSSRLRGRSTDEITQIISDSLFSAWIVGMSFQGAESAANSDGNTSTLFSTLSLTDVSELPPVSTIPLPPAIWLFGTALAALVGIGRRHRLS